MKQIKSYLPVFIVGFLLLPLFVHAICIIEFNTSGIGENGQKLLNLIDTIISILQAIGIGIAVIMVIWGGIMYMTAGGDEAKAGNARKLITSAAIGFAIVIASSFVLCLVEEIISNSLS